MNHVRRVIVFADEWYRNINPVRIYNYGTCINLNSQSVASRDKLREILSTQIPDCQNGVPYDVVICNFFS